MNRYTDGSRGAKAAAIALLLGAAASALGCAANDPRDGAPFDFGLPPGAEVDPPPNTASASTNVSTYPVSALDSPTCAHPTKTVYQFTHKKSASIPSDVTKHLYTDSFDEGMDLSYAYDAPINFLVESLAGTVPVYRCLTFSETHAFSYDPTCPGMLHDAQQPGPLGYVYASDAPGPDGTDKLFKYVNSKNDYYFSTNGTAPSSGYSRKGFIGYVPRLACKTLSATCQMFPSSYTGYTVNPGPDPDSSANANYSNNAPAPPWFGNYGRASASVGHSVDAILTGDWGTSNNVDWDVGMNKAECGYTDWMTGLSSDPGHHGALHAFRCASSEFALSDRNFGGTSGGLNCVATTADAMGNGWKSKSFGGVTGPSGDWDYGYAKHSCGPDTYLAGVSSNPGSWSVYHTSLCCSQSGTGGTDACEAVVVGKPSQEKNTSMTVDELGNATPLDWDPPWSSNVFAKAECGAGRRMMGSSYDSSGALHAILCCGTPAPAPALASTSCCSPQTLQKAVANCNADHASFESDCNNIVAPCCNSDPNSDGVGGATCAAVAAAQDPDATGSTDPDGAAGGATAAAGSKCGASAAGSLAWSYAYKKSGGAGSKTFGASYSGDASFAAGPIYANGEAKVAAKASLFGTTLSIALVDLKGSITDASPLRAQINVLGKDLYVYPAKNTKQSNGAGTPPPTTSSNTGTDWTWNTTPPGSSKGAYDSNSLGYTVTFFTETEVIFIFDVPVTITGTIAGQVGLTASVNSAGDTLAFSATPWVGATVTCTAALGGGKGSFKLEAGVEGTLNLFTASLPTTATISPYTNKVNYTINSDFTLSALSGTVKAYVKAKLKPVFHKTFKTTIAKWNGPTATVHLFHYNGCMTY
jgi:hypothetical protein